ncbi:hypothetical protein B0I35DRAFT_477193 [Stachybotrys elegans]|uniref:Zn(2)-C6 fungal-type domain-containing protein n=1 Tax=Stachybotrys elegans TaxID=80388 RepID=A0A8K0STH6_9HYPO|nr:hypothetical protein B0I35DRAFT_477193 [Stachybotrys elegans]
MAPRSRGCQECKARRIGCDLGTPSCRQCLITNRTCSGPVKGALIINETRSVTSRQRSARSRQVIRNQSPALIIQPPPRSFVLIAYTEKFFDGMTPVTKAKRARPWLVSVRMLPQRDKGPALDLAIEAAATAACGVATRDHDVLVQARRMYETVVASHYQHIACNHGAPTAGMFFTTVTLSLFESVDSTSVEAFVFHLTGARLMLMLAASVLSTLSMVSDILIYVQYQTLLAMIVTPAQYLATNPDPKLWTILGRLECVGLPSVMDRLVNHLFQFGDYFARFRLGSDHGTSTFLGVSGALELLLEEYAQEANQRNELLQWNLAGEMQYRDEITAITMAYFEAARILTMLTHPIEPSIYDVQMQNSSQSILDCVSFLSTKPTNCATLRIFFPLALVSLHGPLRLRAEARSALDTWILNSGFMGLHSILGQTATIRDGK